MSWALEDPAGEEAGGVRAAENWHAAPPIIAGYAACCAAYEHLDELDLLSDIVVDTLADIAMLAGDQHE